jgi:hydrogenase/urease accessory protein HupE
MPWWLDLLLLLLAAGLWGAACENRDDVWELLLKSFAAIVLVVVLLGGRQLPLELLGLALALWLPRASSDPPHS